MTDERLEWKRYLWKKQDFPDNYVDSTFLQEMTKNVNVTHFDYKTVVLESFSVTIHISTILLFVGVFILLYTQRGNAALYLCTSTLLSLLCFVIWDYFQRQQNKWRILFSCILLCIILLGLSPMLKTLTKDISSDSLWMFTTSMFLGNILFHDYSSTRALTVQFPDSLSINAAVFASVLLASRLNSNWDVYFLLMLSVKLFALFPIFQRFLRVFYILIYIYT